MLPLKNGDNQMLKEKQIHDSLKASKEDILDLVQNMCDLIRFLDRPSGAANKEFWIEYLEFVYANFNRIFTQDIRNYLLYRNFLRQTENEGGVK